MKLNFIYFFINLYYTFQHSSAIIENYEVNVETITSAKQYREYDEEDIRRSVEKHFLSEFNDAQLLELCTEAKKFVFPKQTKHIDSACKPHLFWITYSDFTGINSVVIRCLTNPQFYLRKGDSKVQLWIMKEDRSFRPPEIPKRIDQFELQIESTGYLDVRSMSSYDSWPYYGAHFLVKLSKEELSKLCLRVKRHAALDGTDSEIESSYHLVDKMVYPEYVPGKGRNVYYIGMSCKTIPRSWLRLTDDTMKGITIMIRDWDKYQNGNYTFEIRSVKYHQVSKNRDWNKRLDGIESKYWDPERLLICFFAKKYVKELMLIPEEPVLKTEKTDDQALYSIKLSDRVEEHIAFACPSSPLMYAYFDTFVEKHIIVLLVGE